MSRLRDEMKLKRVKISDVDIETSPLEKLTQASLLEIGQKDPIKLSLNKNGRYKIIYGRRRLTALIANDQNTVLAIIVENIDDTELAIQALVENSGKPNPIDEARHLITLQAAGHTLEQIGKMVGYSTASISQRSKLAEKLHPNLQDLCAKGNIKISGAIEITKLPKEEQNKFVDRINNGEKPTNKMISETVRLWQTNQIGLFEDDIFEANNIKPGLFLNSEQVERLLNNESIMVEYNGKSFNIKKED